MAKEVIVTADTIKKRKKAFFFSLRSPCTIFALKYTYAKVEKRN